jgi:hypothetical protein
MPRLLVHRLLAATALLAVAVIAVPMRSGSRGRDTSGSQRVSASQLQAAAAAATLEGGVLSFERNLNIVHLTDVHSWLSGHLHEPDNEADYPDVLAFFQHLEAAAHAKVRPTPPPFLWCGSAHTALLTSVAAHHCPGSTAHSFWV